MQKKTQLHNHHTFPPSITIYMMCGFRHSLAFRFICPTRLELRAAHQRPLVGVVYKFLHDDTFNVKTAKHPTNHFTFDGRTNIQS